MLGNLRASLSAELETLFERLVAYLAASLLIFSAFAKLTNLAFFSRAVKMLLNDWPSPTHALFVAVFVFSIELGVGVLLLCYPTDRSVSRWTAALFLVFAAVQIRRAFMQAADTCGCFGLFQGAAFLRPFSTPGGAFLSDIIIAGLMQLRELRLLIKSRKPSPA